MKIIQRKLPFLIVPLITTASLLIKMFNGLNGDEEWVFAFLKYYKIAPREILLKKSWDILQITGTINSQFAKILQLLPSSNDYMLLFFRVFTVLLLLICAIRLYYLLIDDFSIKKGSALFFSCLLLLATPKAIYNLDNSTGLMIFYFLFSVEVYEYLKKEKISSVIISAISLTIAVLYYPTIAIVYIAVSLYLLFKKKDLKTKWIFILTPLVIACLFLMYYLSDWKFISTQLIYSLKQTISGNETHNLSNITKIFSDITRCSIFSIIFLIPTIFIDKTVFKNIRLNLPEYSYIFASISMILLMICLSLRIGGSILSGTFVYVVVTLILFKRNKEATTINRLYFLLLLIAYCSSDQNLDYNCRYILPSMIILLALETNKATIKREKIFNLFFSIMLFMSLVFSVVVYVSYDHGNSGLIFDKHENIDISPYKCISMEDKKAEYYESIPEYEFNGENLTIIGEDVYVGAYSMYDCNPLTVNMSSKYYSFGERWINFYKFVDVDDCYIMLDKINNSTLEDFAKKDTFGEYLLSTYKINIESENDRFIIYKLSRS